MSIPPNLHSFSSKTIIHMSLPPPKMLIQKTKNNHQGDSNKRPIKQSIYSILVKLNLVKQIVFGNNVTLKTLSFRKLIPGDIKIYDQ